MEPIRSNLVVISWWSNCLGLTCLHHLVKHTRQRNIYVVQVGKSKRQKNRFRKYLPASVQELPYSEKAAAEHGRVIEAVAYKLLAGQAGLWFVDHDTFVDAGYENWLNSMDQIFTNSNLCLCYPRPTNGPAITSPAFWLSPRRLPPDLPDFAATPYRETALAKRPDLCRPDAELVMPGKDTLVLAKEFLAKWDMTCSFPLSGANAGLFPLFVYYKHLGGLHTLTEPAPDDMLTQQAVPDEFYVSLKQCIQQLTVFYSTCPDAWLAIEEPVLLQRLRKFQVIYGSGHSLALRGVDVD